MTVPRMDTSPPAPGTPSDPPLLPAAGASPTPEPPLVNAPPALPPPSVAAEPIAPSAANAAAGLTAGAAPNDAAAGPPAEAPALPEPPVIPPPPPPEYPKTVPIAFHGDPREYFRIWIVNTLLSLLTLGVFSAWAKVRKRRYLRGNTEVLGHRFDYTADPWRLLIGNVIVVTFFLIYGLFGAVYPMLRGAAVLIGAGLLPWVVVRSLAFNAHHTVWRGLRFRFHPSLSAAVVVYLLKPWLVPLSLGFYYPAWVRARDAFRVERHRLGTAYFQYETRTGQYYGPYFLAGLIVFLAIVAMGVAIAVVTATNHNRMPGPVILYPILAGYAVLLYFAKHFVFATMFNRMWNGTRLDEHQFHATLKTGRWLGLQFTNLGAIIVSCGLLYPWAVIRSTRYALSCLELRLAGPVDPIARIGSNVGSAVGDTAAEFAGLDFGL